MRGGGLLLSLLSAVAAAASPDAPARRDACALLTAAEVQQITKVPMKQQAVPQAFNCSFVAAAPVPGPLTAVYLSISDHGAEEDTFWTSTKKSAPGKPRPLPGLGDDAFYVRSSPTDAAIYVRKGPAQFVLTGGAANPGLFEAMKTVAKKIAGKL